MKTWIRGGTLLTPYQQIPGGSLLLEDGKILAVLRPGETPAEEPDEIIEADGRYVAPGFIDIHVHGGGGIEVMGASPEKVREMCRAHCKYGTTSILPTTLASPVQDIIDAMDSIREAQTGCDDVNILGVHLEGPFLSQGQIGAQAPEYIIEPTPETISALLDRWAPHPKFPAAWSLEPRSQNAVLPHPSLIPMRLSHRWRKRSPTVIPM